MFSTRLTQVVGPRCVALAILALLSLAAGCGSAGSSLREEDGLVRARGLIGQGALDDAERALSAAPERGELPARAAQRQRLLGKIYLLRGDGEGSARFLEPLHRRTPGDQELAWDLAQAHLLRGAPTEALPILEGLYASPPGAHARAIRLACGRTALEVGDTKLALRAFGLVLAEDPPVEERFAEEAFVGIARAKLLGGEVEEALRLVRARLQTHPGEIRTRFLLGTVYASTGLLEKAERTFREVVAFEPKYPDAWRALGFVQLKLGRHEDSIASLKRAAAGLPGDPAILNNLGLAYAGAGRYQEAELSIRQAIAAAPGSATLWLNLLTLHLEAGDPFAASSISFEVPPVLALRNPTIESAIMRIRTVTVLHALLCSKELSQSNASEGIRLIHDTWRRYGFPDFAARRAEALLQDPDVREDIARAMLRCPSAEDLRRGPKKPASPP